MSSGAFDFKRRQTTHVFPQAFPLFHSESRGIGDLSDGDTLDTSKMFTTATKCLEWLLSTSPSQRIASILPAVCKTESDRERLLKFWSINAFYNVTEKEKNFQTNWPRLLGPEIAGAINPFNLGLMEDISKFKEDIESLIRLTHVLKTITQDCPELQKVFLTYFFNQRENRSLHQALALEISQATPSPFFSVADLHDMIEMGDATLASAAILIWNQTENIPKDKNPLYVKKDKLIQLVQFRLQIFKEGSLPSNFDFKSFKEKFLTYSFHRGKRPEHYDYQALRALQEILHPLCKLSLQEKKKIFEYINKEVSQFLNSQFQNDSLSHKDKIKYFEKNSKENLKFLRHHQVYLFELEKIWKQIVPELLSEKLISYDEVTFLIFNLADFFSIIPEKIFSLDDLKKVMQRFQIISPTKKRVKTKVPRYYFEWKKIPHISYTPWAEHFGSLDSDSISQHFFNQTFSAYAPDHHTSQVFDEVFREPQCLKELKNSENYKGIVQKLTHEICTLLEHATHEIRTKKKTVFGKGVIDLLKWISFLPEELKENLLNPEATKNNLMTLLKASLLKPTLENLGKPPVLSANDSSFLLEFCLHYLNHDKSLLNAAINIWNESVWNHVDLPLMLPRSESVYWLENWKQWEGKEKQSAFSHAVDRVYDAINPVIFGYSPINARALEHAKIREYPATRYISALVQAHKMRFAVKKVMGRK